MKSRKNTIIICLGIVLFFLAQFYFMGVDETWHFWSVPELDPAFLDLRTITHGAESARLGFDPMVENPEDPGGRVMNYPRIWQGLYIFGIDSSSTIFLGCMLVLFSLLAFCLIMPSIDWYTNIAVILAILSPAVLLGIERGNIDIFMFFLLALAIVTLEKHSEISVIFVFLAFFLKLFPIFACTLFFRLTRSKLIIILLVIFVVCALYTFMTFDDLKLIREHTPKSGQLSYGKNVAWMKINGENQSFGMVTKYISNFLTAAILVSSFFAIFGKKANLFQQEESIYLDSFRVGTGIYAGTFLLGNNWDYRLLFLLFTIPQLVIWCTKKTSFESILTIIAVYGSLWYRLIFRIARYFNVIELSYYLDECLNWVAFAGLIFLFVISLPKWF